MKSVIKSMPADPNCRIVKTKSNTIIDMVNNTVVKTNYQKFKFEALNPFETETRVEFSNVSGSKH